MGRRFAVTAICLAISACASMGERAEQPEMKSSTSYATSQSFGGPSSAWPTNAWWTAYGDTQLDTLINEALAGSPSIAIAQARLHRATAFLKVEDSKNKPQVTANTSLTQQKQSENNGVPPAFVPDGWNDYGRATLDFSWEIDFWGKNRAAIAAATSDANAAQADVAQARLMLSTSIASAYAELAREHAALDTAQAAFNVRKMTVELFNNRYKNGLETLGSVRQVEARQASAEADVLSIEEQISLTRNSIAALMGAGPDRGLNIARPTVSPRTFGLPPQLSADLIGRRPDIAAARMRAEASGQRVKETQAGFYPNVNLSAFVGVQSFGIDMLNNKGSSIGSVGPAVSLPIFTAGRLRGQLRGAEAEYAEAVASYDNTVVEALQDVADAATSQKALGSQIAATEHAVEASREAYQIQNNRYTGGLSNYLDVLSAEDTLLANERALSDLKSRSFALDVELVRALGGGYSAPTLAKAN